MEPISTVTGAWTIAKGAGELSKKLFELGKSIKDREIKQKVDEITDALRELKHQASLLEDENRSLREKLKFNGDEYEFRNPFWYKKTDPNRPLCPKCFSAHVEAPIGRGMNPEFPKCLVCATHFRADGAAASKLWRETS
jgi:hypothetical protein